MSFLLNYLKFFFSFLYFISIITRAPQLVLRQNCHILKEDDQKVVFELTPDLEELETDVKPMHQQQNEMFECPQKFLCSSDEELREQAKGRIKQPFLSWMIYILQLSVVKYFEANPSLTLTFYHKND